MTRTVNNVGASLELEYYKAARRLSSPDVLQGPVDEPQQGHGSRPRSATPAGYNKQNSLPVFRGTSPVPSSVMEAAARRLSNKDTTGSIGGQSGRSSPVTRSPRVTGTHAALNPAVVPTGTPPQAVPESARRRLRMSGEQSPPGSVETYLAEQQVADFCDRHTSKKAQLVEYLQHHANTVVGITSMRLSNSGPSGQEPHPAGHPAGGRVSGEFFAAGAIEPLSPKESWKSVNSTLSHGTPSAAAGTDMTFSVLGRSNGRVSDGQQASDGYWQQQQHQHQHQHQQQRISAAAHETAYSRHNSMKSSMERRLSAADSLSNMASLHATAGEVRSILVAEARAKMAVAQAVVRPSGAAAAAGAAAGPPASQLTTDDSEDWRAAQQAARAGTVNRLQGVSDWTDSDVSPQTKPSKPIKECRTQRSRGDGSDSDGVDAYGRTALQRMADWQQLKRSSHDSSSDDSGEERRQRNRKAAGRKQQPVQRDNSSSSSSSEDSWFALLTRQPLVVSSGGATAIAKVAQRYASARALASADATAARGGKGQPSAGTSSASRRRLQPSASANRRQQHRPSATAAFSSSSDSEGGMGQKAPAAAAVARTGSGALLAAAAAQAARSRAVMPSFAGWTDSTTGAIAGGRIYRQGSSGLPQPGGRRSTADAAPAAAGTRRRNTKEQLEHWQEVQRRISESGSNGSSRRSSVSSSGGGMAAAAKQLPTGMRKAVQRSFRS